MTARLWGNHIAGPVLAIIAIASVVGAAFVRKDPSLAAKLVVWTAWSTSVAAIFLMFRAQYDAWKKLDEKVNNYLDDHPRLGLNVVGFFGRQEWSDQADSKNTPAHFSIEHLGGRIPTDVRFDPIHSKRGTWTLCFGALPYVKPPVRQGMEYEVLEKGERITSRISKELGWGTCLMWFVVDTEPQPEQDEYLLTVRYMDGDAERTQTFKLVFDKTRFGFLPNTMHL
jgi:hypothetical protein